MSDLDDLAELLRDKTLDGKLKWQLPADSRVLSKQGTNIIEIAENNFGKLEFFLKNQNGVVLALSAPEPSSPTGLVLKQLFDKARRDALGIDEAISDVRQRLLHL